MKTDSVLLPFVVAVLIVSLASTHLAAGNSSMTTATIMQSTPQDFTGPSQYSHPQNPADPVDVTRVYSSSPAPVGIADYGVENPGGNAIAYKMELSSVTGTSLLNKMSSSNGESLQLNVVMRVNTTSASYVYWLQNVFSPPPKR